MAPVSQPFNLLCVLSSGKKPWMTIYQLQDTNLALHIDEHGRKRHRPRNKVPLFHERNRQESYLSLTQFPHTCQLASGAKSVRRGREKKRSMRGWRWHNKRAWNFWQWRWGRELQNWLCEGSTSLTVVQNHMFWFKRGTWSFFVCSTIVHHTYTPH